MKYEREIDNKMPLYVFSLFCVILGAFVLISQNIFPRGGVPEQITISVNETQQFHDFCIQDRALTAQYDCSCLTAQHFELQQKNPNATTGQIADTLNLESCSKNIATAEKLNSIIPAAGLPENPILDHTETADSPENAILNHTETIEAEDSEFIDISDENLEEMQHIYELCENDKQMNSYYDCQCLSLKYLDTRIEKGPEISQSRIIRSLNAECPNTPAIAGQAYSRCIATGALRSNDTNIEEFCSCVGRTFVDLYTTNKIAPETNAFYKLTSTAMIMCSNY